MQTRDNVLAHFVQRCHFIFFTHRNDPVSTFEVFRRAAAHVPSQYRRTASESSWVEFMALRDTAEKNYLAAKLFYYVTARDDFRMYGTPHPGRETLAPLFRQLLDAEARCREPGTDILSSELFSIEIYDMGGVLRSCASVEE